MLSFIMPIFIVTENVPAYNFGYSPNRLSHVRLTIAQLNAQGYILARMGS